MRSRLVNRYLIIFFAGGLIATLVVFIVAMVNGNLAHNFWIFRCDASGYSDAHYLAYCADPAYGDYEHIALYGGLEPEAIRFLQKADVLLLGNSKARRAFDADAVSNFFNVQNTTFYNLGFGYGEYDLFPKKLITKYALKPKVVIINADYFFYNSLSIAAKQAINDVDAGMGFFVELKAQIQSTHQNICNDSQKRWIGQLLCQDSASTFYRSRNDGRGFFANVDESQKIPASINEMHAIPRLATYINNAQQFLSALTLPRHCVFLTVVPSVNTDRRVAIAVSDALALPYIETDVTPYNTYDGNHMTRKSAQDWSRAMLKKTSAQINACLKVR